MPVPASIVSFSSCVLLMCHFFFVLQFYGLLPAQFCCLLLAQSTIFTASVQCLRNESAYSVLKNRFSTIFSGFFLPILAWTSMFKSSVLQNFLQKTRKPIGTCPTGLIHAANLAQKILHHVGVFAVFHRKNSCACGGGFAVARVFARQAGAQAPAVKQKKRNAAISALLFYSYIRTSYPYSPKNRLAIAK